MFQEQFCHLPGRGRDLTFDTPSLAFLHDMTAFRPTPQSQSIFFQLPQELRDEIYGLVLTSHSSDHFAQGITGGCVNCDDCRKLAIGTSTNPGYRSPSEHDTMSTNVDIFRVCRRIYDEARPILHQVNGLYIDGKCSIQHYLFDLSTSFFTHRGIILPTSSQRIISIPINLVFSFDHLHTTGSNSGSSELQIFRHFGAAIQSMPPLHFRKLNILIRQSRQTYIADYVPLLRALITLPPVQFSTLR